MGNKLKIIFCTDGIFPHSIGGMQRHSRLLIEELAKNERLELMIIHPHPEKIFSTHISITEFSIEPVNTKKNYLSECYQYSKRVYEIVEKYPDWIIYSQGLSIWYNIKKLKNRKLIVNPHGLEPYQALAVKEKIIAIPFRIVFSYIFNHATAVVSLGGLLTDILKKQIKRRNVKIVVLPNGVNPNPKIEPKAFHTGQLNLLFIARFAHNKGIHILLKAIRELNEAGFTQKLEFYLGGKGPLFEQYKNSHAYPNVHYLGFVSDEQLTDLYTKSDLFVFPTLFEGMPTVVLEAMSFGLPVIVSNVGATAELVDETNGYLIPKNDVNALKAAIVDFYQSDLRKKNNFSKAALQKVTSRYTWTIIANSYVQLFEKL